MNLSSLLMANLYKFTNALKQLDDPKCIFPNILWRMKLFAVELELYLKINIKLKAFVISGIY